MVANALHFETDGEVSHLAVTLGTLQNLRSQRSTSDAHSVYSPASPGDFRLNSYERRRHGFGYVPRDEDHRSSLRGESHRPNLCEPDMPDDRIDFISAYCDRWCERCAFTNRCSSYAVEAALGMCDGDFKAALELAIGAPPDCEDKAKERTEFESLLAHQQPTQEELDEIGREMEDRDERVDESPLTTDSLILSTLAHQCLDKHRVSLEQHGDRAVRDAFKIASWDSHLIAAKVHRALDGHDESRSGWFGKEHPIQNDWNGSAKVALLSIDRSVPAWNTIAVAMADADATAIAERLRTLRVEVEREFPDARRFIRPGFDEE